ncbi:MAG: methyltransferase domain-containing protein [Deltaproteobacteria bacterium]|nr:methyltransferase domain-containing protein [Deltaproteobacteria bacterium]
MKKEYVHGYTTRENRRLVDQATTLAELLHSDTVYPPGSTVLEAGCGVGAQTVILARNNPETLFTAIDISKDSLRTASDRIASEGLENVSFRRGDIFHLPFPDESFDHVFVCFVLEHLLNPKEALQALRRVLKSGGTITIIEGDHGSTYFHPDSPHARRAIQCLIDVQASLGGNALMGRQLYPILAGAKFRDVRVSPRTVYVDACRPGLVEGFTKNTFIAMIEGVREQALRLGLQDEAAWEKGVRDLYRTADGDGTFIYMFFKGTAVK